MKIQRERVWFAQVYVAAISRICETTLHTLVFCKAIWSTWEHSIFYVDLSQFRGSCFADLAIYMAGKFSKNDLEYSVYYFGGFGIIETSLFMAVKQNSLI